MYATSSQNKRTGRRLKLIVSGATYKKQLS
jgi:hypothetical protein